MSNDYLVARESDAMHWHQKFREAQARVRQAEDLQRQQALDLREMTQRAEKAERTVAWLRSGGHLLTEDIVKKHDVAMRIVSHLDSEPPEGWKP